MIIMMIIIIMNEYIRNSVLTWPVEECFCGLHLSLHHLSLIAPPSCSTRSIMVLLNHQLLLCLGLSTDK